MWSNACGVVDLAVENEKISFIERVRKQTKKNKEIYDENTLNKKNLYFNNAIQCIKNSMLKSQENQLIVLLVNRRMIPVDTINCKFDYEKLNVDDIDKHFSSLGFVTFINRCSLRKAVKSSITIYW